MKILTIKEQKLIEQLVELEVSNINYSFGVSEILGKYMLANAITSFETNYINKVYGNVVLCMCSEYRHFIITLLKNINKKYSSIATKEVLIPEIGKVSDEELISVLKSLNS